MWRYCPSGTSVLTLEKPCNPALMPKQKFRGGLLCYLTSTTHSFVHLHLTFTCDGILNDCVFEVFTHPFPAAFAWEADVLRVGTVWSGKTGVQGASRHTAHPSSSAVAVGVTGGLKRLALAVVDAIDFAAQILRSCNEHSTGASQMKAENLIRM